MHKQSETGRLVPSNQQHHCHHGDSVIRQLRKARTQEWRWSVVRNRKKQVASRMGTGETSHETRSSPTLKHSCFFASSPALETSPTRMPLNDATFSCATRLQKTTVVCGSRESLSNWSSASRRSTDDAGDCLQPSGVVWRTDEEIAAAARDSFPADVMTCSIAKDLFKLWPVLLFMQGIGTLHQVRGRAIDIGRKMMHLMEELASKYPSLAKLLDPPTVMLNLQAMKIDPDKVVIPAGLAPGIMPAFPGAVGMWTCPSEQRAGELIGHLRATLAPFLLPGVVPQFHYFNAPMQTL